MPHTHRRRFPACLRISTGKWLLIAVFVLGGCATTAGQKPASLLPTERAAAARLEAVRGNPESLRDFFRRMPKGGDLHIHTSGALYPEDLLRIATEKGLCVNPVRGDLSFPPCGPAADAHTLAVAQAAAIQELKERLIGLWSVRGSPHEARAANTHFFAVFGKIWPATEDIPAVLVDLRERAARDHVQYLEVMYRIRDVDNRATALGRQIGWDDDLARLRDRLLAAGLEDLVKEAAAGIDRRHEESLQRLRCGSTGARPGCGVAVRYQQYANRTLPKEAVFAQFVLAFEIAKRQAFVAGVNLVGQENDPAALADFSLQMRMVGVLHGLYPEVKIALHAGELTPELVPQEPADDRAGDGPLAHHLVVLGILAEDGRRAVGVLTREAQIKRRLAELQGVPHNVCGDLRHFPRVQRDAQTVAEGNDRLEPAGAPLVARGSVAQHAHPAVLLPVEEEEAHAQRDDDQSGEDQLESSPTSDGSASEGEEVDGEERSHAQGGASQDRR